MKVSSGRVLWVTLLTVALVGACADKKPEDTTPRRTVEPEPVRPTGPVKKLMPPEKRAEVELVFKSHTGEIERCYNDYVVANNAKKLRGTIIIAVTIGYTKTPTKAWFLRNDFKNKPALTKCFLDRIKQWEFPTWGGTMDYSFRRLTLEEM